MLTYTHTHLQWDISNIFVAYLHIKLLIYVCDINLNLKYVHSYLSRCLNYLYVLYVHVWPYVRFRCGVMWCCSYIVQPYREVWDLSSWGEIWGKKKSSYYNLLCNCYWRVYDLFGHECQAKQAKIVAVYENEDVGSVTGGKLRWRWLRAPARLELKLWNNGELHSWSCL